MYLRPLAWPDTLAAGTLGTAEIEVLLSDGTPFPADRVEWVVDSPRIAELYPYDRKEAKRVRGASPGVAKVTVSAMVRKNYGSREFYRGTITRRVTVVP